MNGYTAVWRFCPEIRRIDLSGGNWKTFCHITYATKNRRKLTVQTVFTKAEFLLNIGLYPLVDD